MDAVLRFVERGLGVAIVPAIVLVDRPGLRAVRLTAPALTRTLSLARPTGVEPTAAGDALRRAIVAAATTLAARAAPTMRLVAS